MANKILFFSILLFSISISGFCQISLTPGGNPVEMAESITGEGVEILNAQITCPDEGYGYYNANVQNLTTTEGIILSTGRIVDAQGPNNTQSKTTEFGAPGNPVLDDVSGLSTFDACVFEFDIIPKGDTIKFDFTFASEEYQEYVGTPFNDIFGFFISGPGIVGDPGLDGFKNIALIPETNIPVAINSVNNGNPDIEYPAQNPEYFHANPLNLNAQLQYDGWTKNLFAFAEVSPCDTFHLKLMIADVSDDEWDSSVLISKIESNSISLSSITAGGEGNMIEGCNEGIVVFTRETVTSAPLTVEYYLGGSAINGVDYPLIGDDPDPLDLKTITIPANEASASLIIDPFADGIPEGLEYVTVYLGNIDCTNGILDSLQFFIQDSLEVSIQPPFHKICIGESVNFNVSDGGTTFNWEPADYLNDPTIKEPTATPEESITYTLTTQFSECIATAQVEIAVTDLQIEFDVTNITCGGSETGSINVTVLGPGTPPIEYEWTGPDGFTSIAPFLENVAAGWYYLTVSDRDDCIVSDSVEVIENPPISATLDITVYNGGFNVTCADANNGSATITASGGIPPYTFQWDDPLNQTTETANNLAAGVYTVTITDNIGCEEVVDVVITSPEPIDFEIINLTDITCHGAATGSVEIAATGGIPGYSYQWNTTPVQIGPIATNLPAGDHEVTITDQNNCQFTGQISIAEPVDPIEITTTVDLPQCSGEATGEATAEATGGTPPYTYSWNTDPVQTGPTATGLEAGTYVVTVTDANGCVSTALVNMDQPLPLTINILSLQNVKCFSEATGSVTVQSTGGTPPYTYAWNTTPATMGNTLTGLSAGTYTVISEDSNQCITLLEVEITEPEDPVSLEVVEIIHPECFSSETGSVTVAASGGTPPYNYHWNVFPPVQSPTLSGVEGGVYSVIATDANDCPQYLSVELINPDPLQANITEIQSVLCHGASTGSATVSVSGGTPPYTYSWNDPDAQTTATAVNLSAGEYQVTIIDDNDCESTLTVEITEPANPIALSVSNQVNVSCFGGNDGMATISATGGSGSYNYLWNDPQQQTSSTAVGLSAGVYLVEVFDNNGCDVPATIEVIITEPEELLASINFDELLCSDGETDIDLTISGGTSPYNVTWTLPDGTLFSGEDIVNAISGNYQVTITDANDCSVSESVTLSAPQPLEIEFEMTPSLCFGAATGTLSITISGGSEPYIVSWEGPNGFTSDQLALTDLEGGIYNLEITDANGCVYTDALTVTQPEDLIITLDEVSLYPGGWNVSCHNSQDGYIFITPSGGAQPYDITWNTANNPGFSNLEDVENLAAGNYEVVLEDANGCVQSLIVELIAPEMLTVQITPGEEPECNDDPTGSLTAVADGGTPGFTYAWTGPDGFNSSNDIIDNLFAGEYTVIVTDQNGCTATSSYTIGEPDAITITANSPEFAGGYNIPCNGGTTGSISIIIQGGTAPFTYQWNGPNGFTSEEEDLSNLSAGNYCLMVTDANNCEETICIEITEPEELQIMAEAFVFPNGSNLSCANSNDGSISTVVQGGTAPFTFLWTGPGTFTSTSPNPSGLASGEYCVTITDANNCMDQVCLTLDAPDPIIPVISSPLVNGFNVSCPGAGDGEIELSISGGAPGYTVLWSGPDGFTSTVEDLSGLNEGTYCVEVTDQNGCVMEECITLTAPLPVNIAFDVITYEGGVNIDCNGNANGAISAVISGGVSPYSLSWTGPSGFSSNAGNISELAPGEYCLTVTDANGCESISCITLTEPDPIVADPILSNPDCSTGDVSVDLNISGGTAPYTVIWSNGLSGEIIDNISSGTYNVSISDANDCDIVVEIEIPDAQPLNITLFSPNLGGGFNITCHGGSDGSIDLNISGGTGILDISWAGPDSFSSTEEDLTNLSAGEYCVTITDELNCVSEACINVTEPAQLSPTIVVLEPISCNGEEDASLTYSVEGGLPPYSPQWSGPDGFSSTSTTISGLAPGIYCLTLTDFNGCLEEECFEIINPDVFTINIHSPEFGGYNIPCYGASTATLNVNPSGGTAPYTYFWTGPFGFTSAAMNITNLPAGEYCLVATDAHGCVESGCITLTQPDTLLVDVIPVILDNGFNISCNGACDGEINVTLEGGNGPFDFTWFGPGSFTSNNQNLVGVCAGNYTLEVRDALNCLHEFSVELTEPLPMEIELISPQFAGGNEVSCFGDSTGTIFPVVTGGGDDLVFEWEGPNGFTSTLDTLELLPAGTYTLTVTDANGCSQTSSITLNEPEFELTATATSPVTTGGTHISCYGGNDGSIDLEITGGTEPYNIDWTGPDFLSEEEDISNLAAGEYVAIIEDANSCVFTVMITLTEPEGPIQADITIEEEILCFEGGNGAISAVISGGTEGYTFNWIGPDGFTSDQLNITGLSGGDYTLMVTDANGCEYQQTIQLNEPGQLVISLTAGNTLCNGNEGFINANVSGGTQPYEYSWSSGETVEDISDLPEGVYTLTVTDANDCLASSTITVGSVNPLVINEEVTQPLCANETDGSIVIEVENAALPIDYLWTGPDGFVSMDSEIFDLVPGEYTVTIVDANECEISASYILEDPEEMVVEISSPTFNNGYNISSYGIADGVINLSVTGGSPPYTSQITGPFGYTASGFGLFSNLYAGTYTVEITDDNDCSLTVTIDLTEPFELALPNGISPNADGFNDYLRVPGLERYPVNKLQVFNRWGGLVYEEDNYQNQNPWFGTNNSGEPLIDGTYFIVLEAEGAEHLNGYLEIRR